MISAGNVNASAILQAIGADSRIGHKLLKPGLGFGGPCFPRDVRAFKHYLSTIETKGMPETFPIAISAINESVELHHREFLSSVRGNGIVFGVTYKKESSLTEESQAFALANYVASGTPQGQVCYVYDDDTDKFPHAFVLTGDDLSNLRDINFVVMMHNYSNDPQFKLLMKNNPTCKVYDMIHCIRKGTYENICYPYDNK